MSWVSWVGYCKRGELDLIKSLICFCIPPAPANAIVNQDDKTTKSEIFEKDITVREQLAQKLSQARCIKGHRDNANVRDGCMISKTWVAAAPAFSAILSPGVGLTLEGTCKRRAVHRVQDKELR